RPTNITPPRPTSSFLFMIRRPPRSTLFPYNDALPIWRHTHARTQLQGTARRAAAAVAGKRDLATLQPYAQLRSAGAAARRPLRRSEEHSLNSSHVKISYAVFCLKKKTNKASTDPHSRG